MIPAYSLPHECEKEELSTLLAQLDKSQRRALRSYVWEVELGERTLKEWLEMESCPVSKTAWYRNEQGNYLRHPLFAKALEKYLEAGLTWQTSEEARAIKRATRITVLAAPDAAQEQVDLMRSARKEEVRLRAAQGILDRAAADTATKSTHGIEGNIPIAIVAPGLLEKLKG